jgi:ubiquinone/menaquinone biosynthesis C-methylase UbiE
MQKQVGNLWFRLMALEYRLKSRQISPLRTLEGAGIQPGMRILDFGCGPGRYALPAAMIVGTEGRVYALDVHPLAIRMVQNAAKKQGLTNLRLIRSDCATGLASQAVDVVLLYDVLHDVENKEAVLMELHRVLKPQGMLSYRDHTLKGERLFLLMQACGLCVSNESFSRLSFKKCYRKADSGRGRQSEQTKSSGNGSRNRWRI